VKVIALMLVSVTDLRGETVFKLIRSFLNYAMVIGAVCVSLSFLGVDTTTLLASLGLMSLAISLGAKDIVADILAGLSLVFERTYYVGDIVQIGDFKGRVLEIGVRSTKLMSGTQDIKIISNHEIGSVINCSKQNSICTVKICLPVTTSIDEVKRLLEDELALVAKKNPHITKGPHYDGILEFVDDNMVIGISAEGPEEYMGDIRFDINQTLQSMAERKLLQYAPRRERR
jgi:small conductance mechanosensitive channel